MTRQQLELWLTAYGRAWMNRDPEAAARLFSEDVTYHETPFAEPARGIEGVRSYWAENTTVQRDVRFRHEVLALEGHRGIARWWAEYVRPTTGVRAKLDGLFVLEFAEDGRCRRLEEWWHRIESGP